MKRIALAGVVGVLVSSGVFAGTDDIKSSNNQIGLQFISTNVDYTETGNGRLGTHTGTLDTEKGNVPGFAVSASAMKDVMLGNDYFQFQYSQNHGSTNYVGSLMGGNFGSVTATSSAKLADVSLRYGKGYEVGHDAMLTPYFELGNHRWERGVNQGETYTNYWYGIGALGQVSPIAKLVLSANALIGKTDSANIKVSGNSGFNTTLGNSTLYRLGLGADYAITKNFHANIGVDYTSFKYGISNTNNIGGGFVAWEPDSKTNNTSYKAGVGYAF